jgi:predicted ATP-dependent serine protease
LRTQNPNTAFIGILQKNKDGSFKGGKEWEHEFEIASELIFNEDGKRAIRTYKNRYGVMDTVKI